MKATGLKDRATKDPTGDVIIKPLTLNDLANITTEEFAAVLKDVDGLKNR